MRDRDGIHFLYNGEGCIRISRASPVDDMKEEEAHYSHTRWHHTYGELPDNEIDELNQIMNKPGKRVFELKGYGRYQVVARGEFKEL